jgi:secondary thiamine-phosphate synthase enzyme
MQLTVTTTKPKQIIDITDLVAKEVRKQGRSGKACVLFLKHTTAALTTADLDPGTDLDMLDAFEKLIPKLNYRHPHNPAHVPNHILASLIGPSLALPLENGELPLGIWQRIVLVELDGPRKREIILSIS